MSAGKYTANDTKIKAILDYPAPKTLKQLQRFIRMVGFYAPLIKDLNSIPKPFFVQHKKEKWNNFTWTPECQKAFEILKDLLTGDIVLPLPDFAT
uniref:RNA-directed DNA polymerase n=1 Tax=Strigamia maritima TaxID=126957 RepID=T1IT20_STRMM